MKRRDLGSEDMAEKQLGSSETKVFLGCLYSAQVWRFGDFGFHFLAYLTRGVFLFGIFWAYLLYSKILKY